MRRKIKIALNNFVPKGENNIKIIESDCNKTPRYMARTVHR